MENDHIDQKFIHFLKDGWNTPGNSRYIGIDFAKRPSPSKAMINSIHTPPPSAKETLVEKNQGEDAVDGLFEDVLDSDQSLDKLDLLMAKHSELLDTFKTKVDQLESVIFEMDNILLKTNEVDETEKKSNIVLPRTDAEVHDESFSDEIHHDDIPSSPRSYISNISETEIDLIDHISTTAHDKPHDKDLLKLKNVVHSTMEVLKFPIEKDKGNLVKLIDLNTLTYERGQILVDKIINLVDSFNT